MLLIIVFELSLNCWEPLDSFPTKKISHSYQPGIVGAYQKPFSQTIIGYTDGRCSVCPFCAKNRPETGINNSAMPRRGWQEPDLLDGRRQWWKQRRINNQRRSLSVGVRNTDSSTISVWTGPIMRQSDFEFSATADVCKPERCQGRKCKQLRDQ